CAAGNEGESSYIVNAPGVSEEALSVAASIDDADHNWQFPVVKFSTPERPEIYVEFVEGELGKKLKDAGDVAGPLVFAGLADVDLRDELKANIKGKVAFIDRGVVAFEVKVARASEAGAIGVVVGNNEKGELPLMGGDEDNKFEIPTIVIDLETATELREALKK